MTAPEFGIDHNSLTAKKHMLSDQPVECTNTELRHALSLPEGKAVYGDER